MVLCLVTCEGVARVCQHQLFYLSAFTVHLNFVPVPQTQSRPMSTRDRVFNVEVQEAQLMLTNPRDAY